MVIDDTAVRDLGLGLKHELTATELRLPTRMGCANAGGLGFIALTILVLWAGAVGMTLGGPERSIGLAILSSLIAVVLLFSLHRVTRWLRYGAIVRITPDHLMVKKHWSSGEPAIKLHLHQVRLEERRGKILVTDGWRRIEVGSGLDPEARRSVAEFLTGVIAGYRGPPDQPTGDVAGEDHASTPSTPPTEVGTTTVTAPAGEPMDSGATDLILLALSRRLGQVDVGQVHLSPEIPPAVLLTALRTYLDLRDDEVLLGIVGVGKEGLPGLGCALTTRRIYWPGKAVRSLEGRPPRCRSLDYSSLPETIGPAGLGGSAIDLGQGRRIGTVRSRPIREALIAFLGAARSLARGGAPAPGIPDAAAGPRRVLAGFLGDGAPGPEVREAELAAARWAWPQVVATGDAARSLRGEIRTFESRSHAASRARVTPALVVACIAVFAAMVARGTSPLEPDNRVMLEWGANFGPSVVFDHQPWRLFASMFLHFGLIHLLFNMYCLATAGPTVERFFGHVGFAGLYVISGLAGSIASLFVHPTVISAGASGAIFGVFGGLLGFLALRHREVPAALLKPMRSGALAFVGYNTLFSLGVPGIDMAAHLGGLVGGFLYGLLWTAATSARSPEAGVLVPVLKRSAVLVVASALLAGLGRKATDVAHGVILADPRMGQAITSQRDAIEAWNAFNAEAMPVLQEFDRIGRSIDELTTALHEGGLSDAEANQMIARLKDDCRRLEARIPKLPARSGEIQQIRQHLITAQSIQLRMLTSLEQFLATGDEAAHIEGPRGFTASADAYLKEFQTIGSIRDAYFKAHTIERVKKAP
jgi:rhomboid protease GluP